MARLKELTVCCSRADMPALESCLRSTVRLKRLSLPCACEASATALRSCIAAAPPGLRELKVEGNFDFESGSPSSLSRLSVVGDSRRAPSRLDPRMCGSRSTLRSLSLPWGASDIEAIQRLPDVWPQLTELDLPRFIARHQHEVKALRRSVAALPHLRIIRLAKGGVVDAICG